MNALKNCNLSLTPDQDYVGLAEGRVGSKILFNVGENRNPDHSSIERNSISKNSITICTLSRNSTACLHHKKPHCSVL